MKIDGKKYCTFYIVRHGETIWNQKNIVQGQLDSPLTEKGRLQAILLSEKFSASKIDSIFSSDLLRAKKTAEIIAYKHNLIVKTTLALRERNYGIFQGESAEKLLEFNQLYTKKYNKPKYSHTTKEGIESNAKIMARVISFLQKIAAENIGKTIVLVSHNGIISTLLIFLNFATQEELPRGAVKNLARVKLISDGFNLSIIEAEDIDFKWSK